MPSESGENLILSIYLCIFAIDTALHFRIKPCLFLFEMYRYVWRTIETVFFFSRRWKITTKRKIANIFFLLLLMKKKSQLYCIIGKQKGV